MVRDGELSRVTHREATHIVKAWTDEYPRLAENEYFCMRAAMHAKLEVPNFQLSKGGKFLVVERFDLKNNGYLGFEDFFVLNGKTASQKYDGSYEGVTKRINEEQTRGSSLVLMHRNDKITTNSIARCAVSMPATSWFLL